MNRLWIFSFSLFLLLVLLQAAVEKRETYIVYMGAIPDGSNAYSLKESHLQLLSSALKKRRKHVDVEARIIHRYKHGFSGFAAKLTKEEALAVSKKKGVVSVFADPIYQLHTTHSWEFLEHTQDDPKDKRKVTGLIQDTIIGILDTGILPQSESFDDSGMGPIPKGWKGVCNNGIKTFTNFTCNKKLIGARFYNLTSDEGPAAFLNSDETALDDDGHGTHTSSIAAGTPVSNASYYGLANGTARGGSISSRIAMYKVCTSGGCPGSAILAGMDDAISDGVDLLSISIGASATYRPDFNNDPIAIGALHAVFKGIAVVSSAGNDGPDNETVVNTAPWILTVAASTINRHFQSDVVLGVGDKITVVGEAINFSNLNKSAIYPLIDGGSAANNRSSRRDASHCEPRSLDGSKIKGSIVLCKHSQNDSLKIEKADSLQRLGAVGAILADDMGGSRITDYITFPVTEVTPAAADDIRKYMNSTNPVATIRPSVTVFSNIDLVRLPAPAPAPAIAYFSSRGPSPQTSNILKPDIAAPGVNILASWIPPSEVPPGHQPSKFKVQSGSSMASPHVAAVAAMIKAVNPNWSPSAIRSAIMTTANIRNDINQSLTTDTGALANPFDFGAGEVNPDNAADPGLVYELEPSDYLDFLCNYGYDNGTISLMVPGGYQCKNDHDIEPQLPINYDMISNLNYPSISISKFREGELRVVRRTLTYVAIPGTQEADTTYLATVDFPSEFHAKVEPNKLQFTITTKKQSYNLTFSAHERLVKGNYFGSITWTDGVHDVRSPIVIIYS